MSPVSTTKYASDLCPIFGEDALGKPICYYRGTYRNVVAKTSSYTCLKSDSGTVFTTTGAGAAVTFTLPTTAVSGWHAWFINSVAQDMTITAPTDTLVAFNDATATSVAFTTTGEEIGSGVYVVCDGTYYYAFVNLGAETVTPTIA